MGFSLHIQRVDGRDGDLPVADISTSIDMFNAIPWKEEISAWDAAPEEEKELRRPLLQIFDDSGHSLHITAYSEELIALAYNFPSAASPFGMDFEDGYIGTDQYPRSEIPTLFQCFFSSDTEAMLALLGKFPTAPQPN
jgi:hypothetical protein